MVLDQESSCLWMDPQSTDYKVLLKESRDHGSVIDTRFSNAKIFAQMEHSDAGCIICIATADVSKV